MLFKNLISMCGNTRNVVLCICIIAVIYLMQMRVISLDVILKSGGVEFCIESVHFPIAICLEKAPKKPI